MKALYLSLLLLAIVFFFYSPAKAQSHFDAIGNIDAQPVWGPVGYDYVEYYYIPDADVYYNVPQSLFYYKIKGNWISNQNLPSRFRNYDLHKCYKVVLNENEPWTKHAMNKKKFASFKGRKDQMIIRDTDDSRYYVIQSHPEHNQWVAYEWRSNENAGEEMQERTIKRSNKFSRDNQFHD